jgi:hypothetical protein
MEYLAYYSPPLFLFVFVAILNIALFELGRVLGKRHSSAGRDDPAFGVAQGAIFGLAALILGFSFSLAQARFDIRRHLVVEEANAIGTAYLRASFLPPAAASRFRSILTSYTRLRLAAYTYNPDLQARLRAERKSVALQSNLWGIAVDAGRADPHNTQLSLLTAALNGTIDLSSEQAAVLKTHVPTGLIAFVIAVSGVVAILVGFSYGRTASRNLLMTILFSLLFSAVVSTIVDLDRPQRGLIRVNLTPLQTQLQSMKAP